MPQQSVPYIRFDWANPIPAATESMRGQIRMQAASYAGDEDSWLAVIQRKDGTIAWVALNGVNIQSADSTIEDRVQVIDFSGDFTVSESPNYEANIGIGNVGQLVVSDNLSQSASDNPTNASTANYLVACSLSLALPPGTWTVNAIGGLMLQNPGGVSNVQIAIDGDTGTARALTVTTEMQVVDDHRVSGVSGNRSIAVNVRFKSSSAGTTSSRNPWVIAIATRSAA